jgi:hypothetical protein
MLKRKRPIRAIRPEEQLRLPIQMDQLLLDPGRPSRNKKVDHRLTKATSASSQHLSKGTYINIFLETTPEDRRGVTRELLSSVERSVAAVRRTGDPVICRGGHCVGGKEKKARWLNTK